MEKKLLLEENSFIETEITAVTNEGTHNVSCEGGYMFFSPEGYL